MSENKVMSDLDIARHATMRPIGEIAAAAGINEEAGLTLLDGETGSTIANFDRTTRDVTFDELGRLYAVTDSAILRLE